MALLAIAAIGLASYETFFLSPSNLALLAILLTARYLTSNYQFKVPFLNVSLTGREFLIFFAGLWLGFAGAVMVYIVGAVIVHLINLENKKHGLLRFFIGVISAGVSAKSAVLIASAAALVPHGEFTDSYASLGTAAIFLVSMGVINYALRLGLEIVGQFIVGKNIEDETWQEKISLFTSNLVFGILGSFVLHIALLQFGLSVAWVTLPLLLVGHLMARDHFRRLQIENDELSEINTIHLATVEALAVAIDARDQLAHGHVRRMQLFAEGLGKALGLSSKELEALRISALLHDVGKLAVPDSILNKPGDLSPEEMEKVKIHAAVGASILETINFPYPVVPAVRSHHEAWDGSGYPDGLAGEDIPLLGRILSIVDAYDTMRTKYTYGANYTKDEARRVLQSNAGKKFDPKLVDVFLRHLREFENAVTARGLSYSEEKYPKTDGAYSFIDQIKRVNREMFIQYDLTRVFGSAMGLRDTLKLFVEKVKENLPFDTCAVYLYDKSHGNAVAMMVEGKNDTFLKDRRVKPGEGATGYVLQKEEMVDPKVDPALDFMFYYSEVSDEYTAMLSLPLISENKLIGALSIYSCELEIYDEEQIKMLQSICHIASEAIAKAVYHAETETRALTDPMTGLPNARCLQAQFEKEVGRSKRSGNPFQVVMLDLDGFKAVNDTFGHKVGDTMLKDLAKIMRKQLRDYDFLARYAGDEFLAIVPDLSDEAVRDLCERIEAAVSAHKIQITDNSFARVGVSIGTAAYPNFGENLDQLIVAADKEMYAVKATHKKRNSDPGIVEGIIESVATLDDGTYVLELDESSIVKTHSIN